MAVAHYTINTGMPRGASLRLAMDYIEKGYALLRKEVRAMPHMIDADDHSHLEAQYGFAEGTGDEAKAELEAAIGQYDAATAAKAAMDQCIAKFA